MLRINKIGANNIGDNDKCMIAINEKEGLTNVYIGKLRVSHLLLMVFCTTDGLQMTPTRVNQ
jgi:hypothetical protein